MHNAGISRRAIFGVGAALAMGVLTGCTVAQGDSATPRVADDIAPVRPISNVMPPPPVSPAAVAARHAGAHPQSWGVDLPGITSSFPAAGKQFALTFDACGGPGNSDIDQALIDLLIAERIPSTLFLNKRWIDADPARVQRLAANPLFELANHGGAHKPLSVSGRSAYKVAGTASAEEAVYEVWDNHQRILELTGRAPRFFRAGTAHYDEVAVEIVRELGETPLGFTVNADFGATAGATQVQRAMSAAAPGGIALGHMHRPRSGTAAGMAAALPALRAAGFTFVHL
ncbi:polysaccharide deacetylase family protein [Nocardia alba]|uniref:Peptidoglycan/xylan/chitin deacetylase (PgdA/CDA1 family) n=1 Tax=Nocardia alba TaxID=225051 RepID=A0A4V2PAN1_9NOCA|nr:polysaccharide deacetylase family protein [Nocardia alba]TCJ94215.1 peptidoglycan/xylan/chitin deacetylase (PgdA/CDA1 family) [Nocardia alba]